MARSRKAYLPTRISAAALRRLDRHAKRLGKPRSNLVERYVEEGLRENARDFAVLHRRFIDEGRTQYGIVLTASRRFTRRKGGRRLFPAALRTLLRTYPSEGALRDQLIGLA